MTDEEIKRKIEEIEREYDQEMEKLIKEQKDLIMGYRKKLEELKMQELKEEITKHD